MMENVMTGKRRRKVAAHRSPSGLEDDQRKLDSPPKLNGKKVNLGNLTHGAHSRAVHVDAKIINPTDVPASETSALWIPLNGSGRDALSTLIPRQVSDQGNGSHHSASAATAKADTAPATLTGTLADTSVVHAIRGRVRLRVPVLKTSPSLAEPLQRLLRDQPGVDDVTVNDWCSSVTVRCDPSKWASDRLCLWVQLLNPSDVLSYKSANESVDQAQAPSDEAGN